MKGLNRKNLGEFQLFFYSPESPGLHAESEWILLSDNWHSVQRIWNGADSRSAFLFSVTLHYERTGRKTQSYSDHNLKSDMSFHLPVME